MKQFRALAEIVMHLVRFLRNETEKRLYWSCVAEGKAIEWVDFFQVAILMKLSQKSIYDALTMLLHQRWHSDWSFIHKRVKTVCQYCESPWMQPLKRVVLCNMN